ncbi:uncharacterized protein isoform X1 [Leptinotarsa decemlineata]|uniref:uncharacterized protein isoform X1 n=1 Tax=Leptinotarsa decemlineata TaxID=7539 RepID=UPI003D30C4FA
MANCNKSSQFPAKCSYVQKMKCLFDNNQHDYSSDRSKIRERRSEERGTETIRAILNNNDRKQSTKKSTIEKQEIENIVKSVRSNEDGKKSIPNMNNEIWNKHNGLQLINNQKEYKTNVSIRENPEPVEEHNREYKVSMLKSLFMKPTSDITFPWREITEGRSKSSHRINRPRSPTIQLNIGRRNSSQINEKEKKSESNISETKENKENSAGYSTNQKGSKCPQAVINDGKFVKHIVSSFQSTGYQVPMTNSKFYILTDENSETKDVNIKNSDSNLVRNAVHHQSPIHDFNEATKESEDTSSGTLNNSLDQISAGTFTEDYRTSLIEQMDLELENMRQNGFLDENLNSESECSTKEYSFLWSCILKNKERDSAVSVSRRTTKYSSTTSTESGGFEDFDEGIGMEKSSTPSSRRLDFIVEEIKTTEKKYVDDLLKIVKDFIPYISFYTSSLVELDEVKDLFACIKDILHYQLKFLAEIDGSENIDGVIGSLISNGRLLAMYPKYFRIKPKTDEVLKPYTGIFTDMKEKFGDFFDFSAYLLIPIQRLGKYILFLEKVEKEQKKLGISNVRTLEALKMVRTQMTRGNTFVAIDSIRDSPLGESDENFGSFVMSELFDIDKCQRMVFLFEKTIIFATPEQDNQEIFLYWSSIKMDDLKVVFFDNLNILLIDVRNNDLRESSKTGYVLEVKSEKTCLLWEEKLSLYSKINCLDQRKNSLNKSNEHQKDNKGHSRTFSI